MAITIKCVSLKNGTCAHEPRGQGSDHRVSTHPVPQSLPPERPGVRPGGKRCTAGYAHLPPPQSGAGRCRSKGHPTSGVSRVPGSCFWSHLRNTAKAGGNLGGWKCSPQDLCSLILPISTIGLVLPVPPWGWSPCPPPALLGSSSDRKGVSPSKACMAA